MIGGRLKAPFIKCLIALAGAAVLGLSACSTGSQVSGMPSASGPAGASVPVNVVASTNVYGDIAKTVGGSSGDSDIDYR